MQKAKINIEVTEENAHIIVEGPCYLLMKGLTSAIKWLEKDLSKEKQHLFRITILEMLNDRD